MKIRIKKNNKPKMNKRTKKFIIIFSSIVGAYIAVVLLWFLAYTYASIVNPTNTFVSFTNGLFGLNTLEEVSANESAESSEENTQEQNTNTIFGYVPNKTFFAIYGVDKAEKLADVIMVACFDKTDGTISVISVPRDTGVVIPSEYRKELADKGVFVPNYEIKINAVHSWADKYGNEALTNQLNEILDIDIDYYFEVNIQAFIDIVDAVGGVEVDVPDRLYYSDPMQDLLIDLHPGVQTLDGENAQGFVRFRQYTMGDIDRIDMQKVFISAMLEQVLSKEAIMNNLSDFVTTIFKHVKTNMKLQDGLKYTQFMTSLSGDKLTMETLPGIVSTPYKYNKEETKVLVDRLFYNIGNEEESSEATTEEASEEATEVATLEMSSGSD